MISYFATGGHTSYNLKEYVCDTVKDLDNLPVDGINIGSYCFVIETSDVYMLNSEGEWVLLGFGN